MAEKKISELTPISSLAITDKIAVVADGITRLATIQDVATFMGGGVPQTVTANTVMAALTPSLICDTSAGSITVTLPTAASMTGQRRVFSKLDGSDYTATIKGSGSELIGSENTYVLEYLEEFVELESTGTGWRVTAE